MFIALLVGFIVFVIWAFLPEPWDDRFIYIVGGGFVLTSIILAINKAASANIWTPKDGFIIGFVVLLDVSFIGGFIIYRLLKRGNLI